VRRGRGAHALGNQVSRVKGRFPDGTDFGYIHREPVDLVANYITKNETVCCFQKIDNQLWFIALLFSKYPLYKKIRKFQKSDFFLPLEMNKNTVIATLNTELKVTYIF